MATRRFGVSVGENIHAVTEAVGSAVAADSVEVTIELANTHINDRSGGTRAISKDEVLNALDKIKATIAAHKNWPPA